MTSSIIPTSRFHPLLAAFLLALPASAAVQDWFITKVINYRQSADNTQPASAAAWIVEVAVLTDPGDATSATISGGGISGSLNLNYEDGEWVLDKDYPSEAAMNAEFPSNTGYTITLSGGTLGTLAQSFTLGPANYPAVPYLTGPDLTRAHSIDASNDFTLRWNNPGPNGNAIWLEISDTLTEAEAADYWIDSDPLPTSQVISGGTLNPGYTYEGDLGLVNSVENDGSGGFGAPGQIEHAASLVFDLNTVLSPAPQAIVGAWQLGDGATDGSGILVFQANGVYFNVEIGTDDPNQSDGMERGTYTWNEVTGVLTAIPDVDQNGEAGLSDPSGEDIHTVSGDELTVADDLDSDILHRLSDASNPIVGGWQLCDNAGVNTGFIAFLDNGTYFHAEVSNGDPGGATGIERGTYSYNSGTGILTATSITTDTNLEFGLSNPMIGYDVVSFPSPRVLDLYDGDDFTLHRISNASVLQDWRLNKGRTYNQTADNTAPSVSEFWDLYSSVETRNATDATTVTLSGGNFPSPVTLTEDAPGDWTYEQDYATQALLDADIPDNQDYTFTLSGGELGTISQTINSGSSSYPSIPYLTATIFTDAKSIDPTEDFDFTWNAPTPIDAGVDFVVSSLPDEEGDEFFAEFTYGGSGSTLPALSLPAGQSAYGYLEFGATSTNSSGAGGFGVSGFSGRQSITYNFSIDALGSSELVSAAAEDAGLSGPDAEALAIPFGDGVENLVKYAFNMNLGGADTSTLTPGSGSSGLPVFELDDSGPSTVFSVEFIRRKGSGLVYTAKSSPDLGAGSFVAMSGAVTVTPIAGNDEFERVTVSEPCDPATTPRCFGIVEVSAP